METNKGQIFEINSRFEVDRTGNTVYDRQRNTRYRLEPRLMRLLCLLADHERKVVARETIIKEIWDDYPGAGDGLNQGISHLRKVLEDDDRTIIRTLPKIGYMFEGLTQEQPENETNNTHSQTHKKTRWANVITLLLIVAIGFFAWTFFKENKSNKTEQRLENDPKVAGIDEARQYFREDQKQAEDSLLFVHPQVIKFANLHINDINNKAKKDSMEYWSRVQDRLLLQVASAKASLDSLRKASRP